MTSILRSDTGRPALAVPVVGGAGVKENTTMAARTKKTVVKVNKSDRFRTLLREGKSVQEIVDLTGDGYPFVYGVAKKTINPETGRSFAETAAARRSVKAVHTVAGVVTIRPDTGGVIRVDLATGAVKRSKN